MRRLTWAAAAAALLLSLTPFRAFALGKPAWAKPLLSRPTPSGAYIAKNDDWVTVYAEVEYSLSEAGAIREYHRYILENRTDKPKTFTFGLPFDEGAQELSELQVNVDRGSHWSLVNLADRSVQLGTANAGQYRISSVEEVEAGMRVVLEYFLQNRFSLLPFEDHTFLEAWPTAELVLRVAARDAGRLRIRVVTPEGEPLPPSIRVGAEGTVTATSLPAHHRIPGGYALQPGRYALYPWAVIYAVPNGAEDAAFLGPYAKAWEEARGKQAAATLAERAKAVVGEAATPEEKLRRIGDFVQHQIQYDDSNSQSIHAWVPLEVGETLRSMKGDCKGKTLVAQILLAAVGIESKPVLLRMDTSYYRWEAEPATSHINHVILAAKVGAARPLPATLQEGPAAGWVLCDPVQLSASFGQALPMYEGLPAYLVGAEGVPRFTVRTLEPSAMKASVRVTFKVDARGAISGECTLRDNGGSALGLGLNDLFGEEDIRLQVAGAFPAAMNRVQLQEVKVLRADREGAGLFELRTRFTLPNASQSLGESLLIASPVALACEFFGLPNGYWPPTPPNADDKVELAAPWDGRKNAHGVEQRLEVEAQLELPPGFRWTPPTPRKERTAALECDYAWSEVRPGVWKAVLTLARHRGYWPVEERKTRLKFEDALFTELSRTLELKKG